MHVSLPVEVTTQVTMTLPGGMARGRPALATLLMTTGVMALAVPLSSNFAGEFLILAGAWQQGWAWAVVGAVAIVLAAMYMLRLISAVLHREVGPAVPDAALDLRPAELGFLVPLVACLLALSAWPAAVSHRSFGGQVTRSANDAFSFNLSNGPQGIEPTTLFPPDTSARLVGEVTCEIHQNGKVTCSP